MVAAESVLTAEEYWTLPERACAGKIELVEGRLVAMPPVGPSHGFAAVGVATILSAFVMRHGLGRVGVEIGFRLASDPDTVLAPDVCFIAQPRVDALSTGSYVDGVPDLAVEVMSANDSEPEIAAKIARYMEAGTPRAWVVRPATKRVSVHFDDGTVKVFTADQRLTSHEAGFAQAGFEASVAQTCCPSLGRLRSSSLFPQIELESSLKLALA